MRDFLKPLLIFFIPISCFVVLLIIIDPFNYLIDETIIENSNLKERISLKVNSRLFKWIKYKHNPVESIILGDSRSDQLKEQYFEENLKEPIINLSYGGGTLPEIIETFNQISKINRIKKLYIGISFNLYNGKNSMNLVPEAVEISTSISSYLTSKYCVKSSIQYLQAMVLNKSEIETPPFTKDEFWDYQLYSAVSNFYRAYTYPGNYYNDLKKISDYCLENNVELIFIIPPTHTDLQKRIDDFNLAEQEKRFKSDIITLGDVFDFDYPNELTSNKSNFIDPFHSIDSISKIVVTEVTTGKTHFAKYYSNNNSN